MQVVTSISNPLTLQPLTRPLERGSISEQRYQLKHHMTACRASTLALAQQITEDEYCRQAHPDFSPVGWHLGHIAFTEALWILEHLAGQTNPLAKHRLLFAADGLPKVAREQVPDLATTLEYLALVRNEVFHYLESAPLLEQSRLWWWLLQHESQHGETISIVTALHRRQQGRYLLSDQSLRPGQPEASASIPFGPTAETPMVFMPAAHIVVGHDGVDAIDNEQPPAAIQVNSFFIDTHPVTQGQFRTFIQAGGYHTPELWTSQGWTWRCAAEAEQPLYWSNSQTLADHPVCGISAYEAEAYAAFVGKRLPTEHEWERAACWDAAGHRRGLYPWGYDWPQPNVGNFGGRVTLTTSIGEYSAGATDAGCQDMLGNVWEWTTSRFEGYPGFEAFPYRGYSAVYFDGHHRVLRGGSWATRPWAMRGTGRNWYYPHIREIFAGFRCACDDSDGTAR